MKKRILSFALTLCFVFTPLPAAFADSETPNGVCGDNLTWVLANGVLTISGTGEMYDYDWGSAPWYEFKDEVTKLVIEQGATSIGDQTFIGLTKLADVQLSGGIVSIGDEAFYSCESLKSVVIPEGTKSIGVSAFGMCSSLGSVTLPDSLTTIEVYAFVRCNLKSFTIPSGWTEFDQDVIYSNDALESINVSAGNNAYSSENGVLFNKDKTELIMYPMGKTDSSYTIPSSVTDISYYALQGGKFKSVTIPDSVESIGTYAFAQCKNLEKITIPDSVPSMYDSVFCECTALTNASLPRGVSSISCGTFDSCTSLKSVNIPSGVKRIEDRAFNDCTSLSNIYFGDGSAQWEAVTVGADNNGLNKATVHDAQHTHSYRNGKCTRCGASDPKYIAAPALKITTVSGHPKIYWNSVDGAYKYWIYRSTDGKNYNYLNETKNTSYIDKNVKAGKKYYYKVQAVALYNGTFAIPSAYSYPVSITAK